MLIGQIPERSMEVVRLIRQHVPRPTKLPIPCLGSENLRWSEPDGLACPMGLCLFALKLTPIDAYGFGNRAGDEAVAAFGGWWDCQHDIKAAINAVWGE